jgi:hypothetical protein
MDTAKVIATLGGWLVLIVVIGAAMSGLVTHWAARTCGVSDSTYGKGFLAALFNMITGWICFFLPEPVDWILSAIVGWFVIMGVFHISIGKSIITWLLSIVYAALLIVLIAAAFGIGEKIFDHRAPTRQSSRIADPWHASCVARAAPQVATAHC